MFELQITQITQCKHYKGGVRVIISEAEQSKVYFQMCTKYRVHMFIL